MRKSDKSWALLLIVVVIGGLLWTRVLWWQFGFSYGGVLPTWVYALNVVLWSATFLVGLYQLGLRLSSSIRSPDESSLLVDLQGVKDWGGTAAPNFSLVYLTCDDFVPEALERIFLQQRARYNVVVGNDGHDPDVRVQIEERIAAAAGGGHDVSIMHWSFSESDDRREPVRNGKSANLNRCIAALLGPEDRLGDWLVVLDADTTLPLDYLETLGQAALALPADVGLIQGRNTPHSDLLRQELPVDPWADAQTPFQRAIAPELDIIYRSEMPSRARHGFVPFMGHGGAIRKQALLKLLGRPGLPEAVGGGPFPDLVSEDFALSVELRRQGFRSAYVEELSAHEPSAVSIDAYLVRVRKLAGGAAEALLRVSVPFLCGTRRANRVSLLERIDAVLILLWAALAPVALFNLFLSGVVAGSVWQETAMPLVHEALLYVIAGTSMVAMLIPLAGSRSVSEGFISSATLICVFLLSMPVAALAFVRALFVPPRFVVTPKSVAACRAKRSRWTFAGLAFLAFVAIAIAVVYASPFSPVLLASAAAFLSLPALRVLSRGDLDERPLLRSLAWCCICLPGGFLLIGLFTMWQWQVRAI